ncbi:hypothetical protein [uncultured Gammaproteobacteria bacterium]|nr:hypothetical protein [uncultured Gammaproteobacteria bacterium]
MIEKFPPIPQDLQGLYRLKYHVYLINTNN